MIEARAQAEEKNCPVCNLQKGHEANSIDEIRLISIDKIAF